jgi:sugar phosphate isomerase/epimerase
MEEPMLEPSKYVLCAVSMWGRGFREHVEAASSAGWDAISVIYPAYRRALDDEGLSPADMRSILAENGIVVDEIEVCHEWAWTAELRNGASNPCGCGLCADRESMIEMAQALEAKTIIATQRTDPLPVDEIAELFAGLCDDAANVGLQVAIEFIPYSPVRSVTDAWDVVRTAGRPNGGLCVDTHHHKAMGGSDEALRQVPGERVLMVQIADGPPLPQDAPRAELFQHMMNRPTGFAPGEGGLDIAGTLHALGEMGVRAPLGPEVRKTAWAERPAKDVSADLRRSVDALVAAS